MTGNLDFYMGGPEDFRPGWNTQQVERIRETVLNTEEAHMHYPCCGFVVGHHEIY